MEFAVAGFGVVIALLGVYGVASPRGLIGLIAGIPPARRVAVAAGLRAAMGILFLLAAPSTGWPRTITAIGALGLFAAVVVLLMGRERLDGLIGWWLEAPEELVRISALVALAFGVLIVMAALP